MARRAIAGLTCLDVWVDAAAEAAPPVCPLDVWTGVAAEAAPPGSPAAAAVEDGAELEVGAEVGVGVGAQPEATRAQVLGRCDLAAPKPLQR